MFYEEAIIDGVLCSRYYPNAEFTPLTLVDLTKIIITQRNEVSKINLQLSEIMKLVNKLL